MNDWAFFANLFTQISGLVQAGGDAMLNGAIGYVRPILLVGITAWVGFQAIAVANGMAPISSLYRGVIRAAVVVSLLQSAATYNQFIGTLGLAIPTEIGNALGNAGGGNIATGAVFDTVSNQAIKAGLLVWGHIPQYSLSGVGMTIAVAAYFVVVMACIGAGFLVYLASTILLILLLKVGPLFVALYAFPQTRRVGDGWAAAVITTMLTQTFSVAVLVLLIGAEQATTTRIVAGASNGAAPNFIDELLVLLEAGLLMWIIAKLVKQVPSIAASIGGGITQGVSHLTGAAFGAPGAIVMGARGAVSQTSGAIASANKAVQARRMEAAVRRSLSGD